MTKKLPSKSMDISVDNFIRGNSVDCVIIGYKAHELHVLILKWKNMDLYALPGGFIKHDEDLNTAAVRVLKDRTGLKFPFLDQFYTFGNHDRNRLKLDRVDTFVEAGFDFNRIQDFLNQRFITTGYFALVDIFKAKPKPDSMSDSCEWLPLKDLPELILDHNTIIKKALEHIKIRLNYLPIGRSLLPELFTMKELQKLYEAILNKELDRGNFQKKILKLGIFNRQEKQLIGAPNKAPYLYKFDEVKYNSLLENGIGRVVF